MVKLHQTPLDTVPKDSVSYKRVGHDCSVHSGYSPSWKPCLANRANTAWLCTLCSSSCCLTDALNIENHRLWHQFQPVIFHICELMFLIFARKNMSYVQIISKTHFYVFTAICYTYIWICVHMCDYACRRQRITWVFLLRSQRAFLSESVSLNCWSSPSSTK